MQAPWLWATGRAHLRRRCGSSRDRVSLASLTAAHSRRSRACGFSCWSVSLAPLLSSMGLGLAMGREQSENTISITGTKRDTKLVCTPTWIVVVVMLVCCRKVSGTRCAISKMQGVGLLSGKLYVRYVGRITGSLSLHRYVAEGGKTTIDGASIPFLTENRSQSRLTTHADMPILHDLPALSEASQGSSKSAFPDTTREPAARQIHPTSE